MDEISRKGILVELESSDVDYEITVINRGHSYCIPIKNILGFPDTKIADDFARAIAEGCTPSEVCLKYNRNLYAFEAIVELYTEGDLHLPKGICWRNFERELNFWKVDADCLSACCYGEYQTAGGIERSTEALQKEWEDHMGFKLEELSQLDSRRLTSKMRMWIFFEDPWYSTPAKLWSMFSTFLLVSSLVLITVFTIPRDSNTTSANQNVSGEIVRHYTSDSVNGVITYSDYVLCIILLLEYVLRFMCCPSKWRFVMNLKMIISVISIIPSIVTGTLFMAGSMTDLEEDNSAFLTAMQVMAHLRILRVVALARYDQYYPTMRVFFLTVRSSAKAIALVMATSASFALFFGSCLYYGERGTVISIPEGMWWALVTMTTLGYGDLFPIDGLGRFVGIVCVMTGMMILVLPIPVISTNYDHYWEAMTRFQEIKEQAHKGKSRAAKAARRKGISWDENENTKDTQL